MIDGGTVYASNQSGRTMRLDSQTGERAWTIAEGSYGPAWPVGGSVFLLSDVGALVRADAATGELLWQVQLPEFFPNRGFCSAAASRTGRSRYYGPILAGGRLWVAGARRAAPRVQSGRRRAAGARCRCPAAPRRRRRWRAA